MENPVSPEDADAGIAPCRMECQDPLDKNAGGGIWESNGAGGPVGADPGHLGSMLRLIFRRIHSASLAGQQGQTDQQGQGQCGEKLYQ
mgnify:CR=1 FL=1